MTAFNFYLIDVVSRWRSPFADGGLGNDYGKVVNYLRNYFQSVLDKTPGQFDSVNVSWGPDNWIAPLLPTDVLVYVVPDVNKSVVVANGGNVDRAKSITNVLGLTDLNTSICEVYFDRMFQGSPKELAGAAFHESAHLKSQMGDEMHGVQDGFLRAGPDYNGIPTKANVNFMSAVIGRTVRQTNKRMPN